MLIVNSKQRALYQKKKKSTYKTYKTFFKMSFTKIWKFTSHTLFNTNKYIKIKDEKSYYKTNIWYYQ